MERLENLNSGLLAKYQLLAAHRARVEDLKGIKEWIAKRPKTPM